MTKERWDDGTVCCSFAYEEHELDRETFDRGRHGHAIDITYVKDGKMWADNLEYATEIDYCPFCGTAKEDLIDDV